MKNQFQIAQHYMPGGVNSPVRAFGAVGGTPPIMAHASGALITDITGKSYIDYVGSWGPMILGHAHPAVIKAVQTTAEMGLSFGAPCAQETELAKMVCDLIPFIDQIRFVNSGTEATMSAIRLARGATGRDKLIKFAGCYHGHADALLVNAGSGALTFGQPSSPGVPNATAQNTLVAQYNDLDSIDALFEAHPKGIAAIIVEPIAGNMNMVMPTPHFLQGLRERCSQHGALLIFDEVMTGFRVALGGAAAHFNITPDIVCYGKVIGGGMPVGAYAANRDLMQQMAPTGPIYQAGTLSGNPIAMSAGIATLNAIQSPGFFDTLHNNTCLLVDGLREVANKAKVPLMTNALGGMFGLFFTNSPEIQNACDVKSAQFPHFNTLFHHLLDQGIYMAPSAFEAGFVSIAHTPEHFQATWSAFEQALAGVLPASVG